MLTELISPSNGSVLQTGLKMKIQQVIAYRRPISQKEISTELG
jgi:hypothetical protein